MSWLSKLAGNKTYIAAAASVLGAAAGVYTGEVTKEAAIQIGVTAVLAALIRSGVKNDVKNSAEASELDRHEKAVATVNAVSNIVQNTMAYNATQKNSKV